MRNESKINISSGTGRRFFNVFSILLISTYVNFALADPPKTALVIIDMQPDFITRGGNDKAPKNVEKVNQILKIQLKAIEQAKKSKIPIVVVEYENHGKTNATLMESIGKYKDAVTLLKNSDGMLESYNTHRGDFVKYFSDHKIKKLIITGANGGACVRASIEGALEENFSVVAVSIGIADFNYTDFIYPYIKQYQDLKPKCKDCTFEEVNDLAVVYPDGSKVGNSKEKIENPSLKRHPSCVDCGPAIRSQAGDGAKPRYYGESIIPNAPKTGSDKTGEAK